jgi:hypothetical protein
MAQPGDAAVSRDGPPNGFLDRGALRRSRRGDLRSPIGTRPFST